MHAKSSRDAGNSFKDCGLQVVQCVLELLKGFALDLDSLCSGHALDRLLGLSLVGEHLLFEGPAHVPLSMEVPFLTLLDGRLHPR